MITDPVKLTQKLVRIESESGNEKELGNFIFKYLKSCGYSPKKQKVTKNTFNVVLKGKSNIQINGHLDTVSLGTGWKHRQGQVRKGRLYGRGSCDIKASIAAVLTAIAKRPCDVNLSFVVEEESTFRGVNKIRPKKYVIELEPTENQIVYCHKGQLRLKVLAKGKAAHASVPHEGDNAILKLNEGINKLLKSRFSVRHNILGTPTLNIGSVQGGTTSNIVPDNAVMHIDRRVLPNEDIQSVVNYYKKLLSPLKVEVCGLFKAAELPKNSKIIKLMQRIVKKHKLNPKPGGVLFTTHLGAMKNVEGLVFGPGSVKQAHQINEFVSVKQLRQAHDVFCDLFNSKGLK